MMGHLKHGKFPLQDYIIAWVFMVAVLTILAVSWWLEWIPFYIVIPCMIAVIICSVRRLSMYGERFTISQNEIVVKRGRKTSTIPLPAALTILLSHASPAATTRQVWSFRHAKSDMKIGEFAVNILLEVPPEQVIKHLYSPVVEKYTSSIVRTLCPEYLYLYSFVYSPALLTQLLEQHKCTVIIPKTLEGCFPIDFGDACVYVDETH